MLNSNSLKNANQFKKKELIKVQKVYVWVSIVLCQASLSLSGDTESNVRVQRTPSWIDLGLYAILFIWDTLTLR